MEISSPTSHTLDVPGTRLFYELQGSGPALVLFGHPPGGHAGFLTESKEFAAILRRTLASILFTDIVGSTETAVALGDRQWRNVLESHDAMAHALVGQHRGRVVKMTGDGVLATFDGPGRAIRCALALRDALRPLGITIRAGVHTGEVELLGDDIGGVGVHIAARIVGHARGGELLVSPAVPLLVAGSDIEFQDRGEQDLRGVGALRLYAVEG